jgi:hypothetical protein
MGRDKHFDAASIALDFAAKAIQNSNPQLIKNVSVDGDNDSAEVIFEVVIDGEKKSYILKLKETENECEYCGQDCGENCDEAQAGGFKD